MSGDDKIQRERMHHVNEKIRLEEVDSNNIKIRLDEVHHVLSETFSQKVDKIDIYRRNQIVARNDFAFKILPNDFYLVLSESKSAKEVLNFNDQEKTQAIHDSNGKERRTTLSRVFKNEGTNGAKPRFQQIVDLLTERNGRTFDQYQNCRYRLEIEGNWKSLLSSATDQEMNILDKQINKLIHSIPSGNPNCHDMQTRLMIAYKKSFPEVLACLTLIACTLYIWNDKNISDLEQFAKNIILPPRGVNSDDSLPNDQILKKKADDARKDLQKISDEKRYVEISPQSAKTCYEKCLKVLNIKPLEDKDVLGETYFILYRCCKNTRFTPPDGMTADFYLKQSQKYGYPEAMKITLSDQDKPLYKQPPIGTCKKEGILLYNEMNRYSKVLIGTLPINWKSDSFCQHFEIIDEKSYKYLLCSESDSDNYNDLLQILGFFKRHWNESSPCDVEVFIRGREESLVGLIDTAQQYMDKCIIPIHIIDEAKMSAEFLLAKHPLFYPIIDDGTTTDAGAAPHSIRDTPSIFGDQSASGASKGTAIKAFVQGKVLHFVILGTDSCAEYLLRTAYWMMTFKDSGIIPKITVIGSDADKFLERVLCKCPGLRRENGGRTENENHFQSQKRETDKLENYRCNCFAETMENVFSPKFDEWFNSIFQNTNDRLYFAISSDDDFSNLETAIYLRKKLIRYYVASAATSMLLNPPPIAFRCKDFHIADMSQNMVVNVINHGNSWYNNHAVIPFGTYSEIYGWNGMVENVIEHLAKCIHLVYSDIEIPSDYKCITDFMKQEISKALSNYYSRQYNKASSYALALSIPYRLFNCKNWRKQRILPASWDISSNDAYFNDQILSSFVDELPELTRSTDSQFYTSFYDNMAYWEHDRWVRWMLSEGWLPASDEDIGVYMGDGSPKHQLYIAGMHPCICEWDDLKDIEKAVKEERIKQNKGKPDEKELNKNIKVDLRSFDLNIARKTRQILQAAVALHQAELPEKENEKENKREIESELELEL